MRTVLIAGAAILLGLTAPAAAADPAVPEPGYDTVTYLIGRCWDPSQPVEQEPTTVQYNCDGTAAMENMTWSSWGADGATGSGTDNAVECKPNCANGPRLVNPIVVHAWNPQPADGCPPNLQFYSDLTVAYPQGVPRGSRRVHSGRRTPCSPPSTACRQCTTSTRARTAARRWRSRSPRGGG